MDVKYRDEVTNTLLGYYTRRVFFGDLKIDEVPKEIKESVEKELKDTGLYHLC